MTETATAKAKTNGSAKAAFLAIGNFLVTITYLFTDPETVIKLRCKMVMTADDKAARQAFYAQPDGDRDAGLYAYQVDMLGRILSDWPEGLPGFEVYTGEPFTPAAGRAAINEYFATGEPILRKIANDAIERYTVISQPAELFR